MKKLFLVLLILLLVSANLLSQVKIAGGTKISGKTKIGTSSADVPFLTGVSVGSTRSDSECVGMKFTTPSSNPPIITELGRWRLSGNTQTHAVKITNCSTTEHVTVNIDMSSGTVGEFKYASIAPFSTSASTTYCILSDETSGDAWVDAANVTIGSINSAAGTLNFAVWTGGTCLSTVNDNLATKTYVPVNFKFHN